jgi:AcrR family transcriptional regulator
VLAVTTAQIALAAGIGEATIFRVFTDKNEVLQACIAAALDPTTVLQELQSISLEQPLAARLVEAVNALDAYLGRMGAVIGTALLADPGSGWLL